MRGPQLQETIKQSGSLNWAYITHGADAR